MQVSSHGKDIFHPHKNLTINASNIQKKRVRLLLLGRGAMKIEQDNQAIAKLELDLPADEISEMYALGQKNRVNKLIKNQKTSNQAEKALSRLIGFITISDLES